MKKFNIFTGLLKAYDGPEGKGFRTTASSSISDLAGDEITASGIEKMSEKAKGNLTIFLNHEYRVPEDVLGSVRESSMSTRGVDSEGNPIVDLDFDIKVNESNPRALQTYESIKSGVKLGTSIGAIVRHAEKKKGGGLRIDDLELLEASIVGIPANPRSWVQYALKSIANLDESDTLVIEDEPDDEVVKEEIPDVTKDVVQEATAEPTLVDDAPEPDVSADVEPDKEAAKTSVTVTVEAEDTQVASPSAPETVSDGTADGDDAPLGDTVTSGADTAESVSLDANDLASIVKRFQEAITTVTDLQKQLSESKAEAAEAKENLAVAKQIVERIADLPVGQKTQFKGAVEDFRKRFPQYDNEFMKFLEK